MQFVDKFFERFVSSETALLEYGFICEKGILTYKKGFHNGEFELHVEVSSERVNVCVFDVEMQEEYMPIKVEGAAGGFVAMLREECLEILGEIRDRCFAKEYFIYPQSNRITAAIRRKYDVEPEFMWDDSPGCGVFRNGESRKWFGIIMDVKREKICPGDGIVEVLNLKNDDVSSVLAIPGIYPAYHMNKKHWLSIVLDETTSDETILDLVHTSYLFACPKRK